MYTTHVELTKTIRERDKKKSIVAIVSYLVHKKMNHDPELECQIITSVQAYGPLSTMHEALRSRKDVPEEDLDAIIERLKHIRNHLIEPLEQAHVYVCFGALDVIMLHLSYIHDQELIVDMVPVIKEFAKDLHYLARNLRTNMITSSAYANYMRDTKCFVDINVIQAAIERNADYNMEKLPFYD